MAPKRTRRPRAPHQLPPGRHKLSREYVERNQRERILDAIAEVTSMAGYPSMSVEDIIGTAGVSRRTFYDAFKSKEDAFLAAVETLATQLDERVRSARRQSDTFAAGVRACLAVFLQFITEDPRQADVLIVEVLAAGPAAIEHRNRLMRDFAELLRDSAAAVPGGQRPPTLTAEAIIGGIYEVVYSRLLQGRASELPNLLPDLAYLMMQPYIGHEVARVEAARASDADTAPPRTGSPDA